MSARTSYPLSVSSTNHNSYKSKHQSPNAKDVSVGSQTSEQYRDRWADISISCSDIRREYQQLDEMKPYNRVPTLANFTSRVRIFSGDCYKLGVIPAEGVQSVLRGLNYVEQTHTDASLDSAIDDQWGWLGDHIQMLERYLAKHIIRRHGEAMHKKYNSTGNAYKEDYLRKQAAQSRTKH